VVLTAVNIKTNTPTVSVL